MECQSRSRRTVLVVLAATLLAAASGHALPHSQKIASDKQAAAYYRKSVQDYQENSIPSQQEQVRECADIPY